MLDWNGRFENIVSIGTFSGSAAHLKLAEIHDAAYPFDWLSSNPSMVADCVEDRFQTFLDGRYLRKVEGERKCHHQFYEEKYGFGDGVIFAHHDPSSEPDFGHFQRAAQRFLRAVDAPGSTLFFLLTGDHLLSDTFFAEIRRLSMVLNGAPILVVATCQVGAGAERSIEPVIIENDLRVLRLRVHSKIEDGLLFRERSDSDTLNALLVPLRKPGATVTAGTARQRLSQFSPPSLDVVDLGSPEAASHGVTRALLFPAHSAERPRPAFILGPASAETRNEFFRERSVWPVSVFTLRGARLIGPFFAIGAMLFNGPVAFSCAELYLDPRWEKTRTVAQDRLARLARGEMTILRIDAPCLLLATNGHGIFGHWLVDFLPKLFLIKKNGMDLRQLRILLPTRIGSWPMDLLALFGIERSLIEIYDPDREVIEAPEIVVPMLLRASGRFSPLFAEALRYLNDEIDRRLGPIHSADQKLYFSRNSGRPGWRSLEDHAVIESKAAEHGYRIVIPERLPIVEQVRLLRACRILAGESGSALHSSIFNTGLMTVGVIHGNQPNWFAGLQAGIGEHNGHRTGYVFADTKHENDRFVMKLDALDIDRFFDLLDNI